MPARIPPCSDCGDKIRPFLGIVVHASYATLAYSMMTTLSMKGTGGETLPTSNGYVGILVASSAQRKYVLKQYLRYNTTGAKLFCFTPSSIDWKKRIIVGLHYAKRNWAVRAFPFPKAVYNRCYGTNQPTIQRLGAAIGNDKCFNHINRFNKHDIHACLYERIPQFMPQAFVYSKDKAMELLRIYKTLYFKPCYGNQGKGVYRAELQPTGDIHVGHHYFSAKSINKDLREFSDSIDKLIGSTPYIMQAGIEAKQWNERTFDIRALVQKNIYGEWNVTIVASRVAYKGSYNTSICEKICLSIDILSSLYPPDQANAIMESIYGASYMSAAFIDQHTSYHLGEFSVDFVLDRDGRAWIIELNGQPQKSLFDDLPQQQEVYRRPIQYASYLCTK